MQKSAIYLIMVTPTRPSSSDVRLADLIDRVVRRTYKHLPGRHAQKRHGWRYGAGAKVPDDPDEAAEYSRRVSRRGGIAPPVVKKKKTAAEKGVRVRRGAVSVDKYEKNFLKEEGVSDAMVLKASNFIKSLAITDTRTGISVVIDSVVASKKSHSDDLVLVATGSLHHPDFGRVGDVRREVDFAYDWRAEDGEDYKMSVHNAYLAVDMRVQGSGFAQRFYQHAEEQAKAAGIKQILVSANIDVGGYAWAKMGFRFYDGSVGDYDRARIGNYFKGKYLLEYDDNYPEFLSRKWQPWEMAAYVAPDGRKFGKDMLLGNYWEGVKVLDDGDASYQVGEAYYASKE
jgi:GNAT superfamily N-acetyltransferase